MIIDKFVTDKKWQGINEALKSGINLTFKERDILESQLAQREIEIREGDHETFLQLCREHREQADAVRESKRTDTIYVDINNHD